MLTVACVLRSGGEYRPEHVIALQAGVRRWLAQPHRFVCLTDQPSPDYHSILLRHDWPGWWAKIELFRPELFEGPVLYADLDTVVVGPLDPLALGHRFTVLQSFWSDDPMRIGSGLMAWTPTVVDLSSLYTHFRADPARHMAENGTKERWGDQGYIRHAWPFGMDRWQGRNPGQVVSWKRTLGGKLPVPPTARIVCFHGKPRPWDTPLWAPGGPVEAERLREAG